MRRNPIRESHPVKGKGQDNKVRLDEGLHASLSETRSYMGLTGLRSLP